MIKTYSFIETPHSKLNEFVIAFFKRIEFETSEFSTDFFEKEFYDNLIVHHPDILLSKFKAIYNVVKLWNQNQRSDYCQAISTSNEIEEICEGKIIPWKDIDIPKEVRDITKKLFKRLYEDTLKKSTYFKEHYGGLLDHYHTLKKIENNDFEYCPACGIKEMNTFEDGDRDQYDHYLPKDKYPFSSINFKNLVPICSTCNSFTNKSDKDILSYEGVVFYPFDEKHSEIDITVDITNADFDDLSASTLEIIYTCSNGKLKEIEAWKNIYNIVKRHNAHIRGSLKKWYNRFWESVNDRTLTSISDDEKIRTTVCLQQLEKRKCLEYQTIKNLVSTYQYRAKSQSMSYSLYN